MSSKPNILFIMADEMTARFTPFYGDDIALMPNLSGLAENGTVFDYAYCNNPICAPSRASMMAGQMVSSMGCAWDNAAEFYSEIPTFAHMLRQAGYRTVLSGKMHFIGADQLHGFEERLTTDVYPADFGWVKWLDEPHTEKNVKGFFPEELRRDYDDTIEYDEEVLYEARRAICKHDGSRPLFLTASFTHPHNPYCAPECYLELYRDADIPLPDKNDCRFKRLDEYNRYIRRLWNGQEEPFSDETVRKARLAYYAMLTYIDEKIGSLIDALKENGMHEDTVIIFTSDHGDLLGEKGMWDKRTYFEDSMRVPLLVSGPGIKKQRVSTEVSLLDLFPTLIDLAHSEWDRTGLEGQSLADGLAGGKIAERPVLAEYYNERVPYPFRSATLDRKKYVHFPSNPDKDLLFDCAADPLEQRNCIDDPAYAPDVELLRRAATAGFDVGRVIHQAEESIRRRKLILDALGEKKTDWNYNPSYDANIKYVR